jgi:3-methyl-2-oxobutanoate hydroxymethyltransferase
VKNQVTIHTLKKLKTAGQKICMVTAYDATFSRLFDEAGADVLLVGDSLGMVVQGHDSTLPVTMDQMVYHSRAVTRGAKRAHVVGDMPFMSYQNSVEEAVTNAGRLVAEGGVGSVKLEGGAEFADVVTRIVRASIPVMGHLGLTPQSVLALGGFRVQGRDGDAAAAIADAAGALVEAGVFSLVLEGIPGELAARITREVAVPTIGIGAGSGCDGQVLVYHDLLGMLSYRSPKFVRRYADVHDLSVEAIRRWAADVREGRFPGENETY